MRDAFGYRFVLATIVALGLFVGVYAGGNLSSPYGDPYYLVTILFCLRFVVGGMTLVSLALGIREFRQMYRFAEIFQFGPPKNYYDWKDHKALQPPVNRVLESLATRYELMSKLEQRLIEEIGEEKDAEERREKLKNLKETRRSVEDDRRSFWQAHTLAKKFGFSTKKKFTEYLEA